MRDRSQTLLHMLPLDLRSVFFSEPACVFVKSSSSKFFFLKCLECIKPLVFFRLDLIWIDLTQRYSEKCQYVNKDLNNVIQSNVKGFYATAKKTCVLSSEKKSVNILIKTPFQDAVPSGFSSGDVLIPLADEYDPMFPNDYEKVVKRHREERQRQREQERQKEIEEREKYCHAH